MQAKMQLRHSCLPRAGANIAPARTLVVKRGFFDQAYNSMEQAYNTVEKAYDQANDTMEQAYDTIWSDTPAAPAQELGRQQLQDAIKYGTIASAAFLISDDEVRAKLQAFRGGEFGNAPFRTKKFTGSLWEGRLTSLDVSLSAATDTEVLCVRLPSASGLEDELVVAFRGTEIYTAGAAADILTDLLVWQAPIEEMKGVPAGRYPKEVMVHNGFLKSFNDVVNPTEDWKYDMLRDVRDELMGKGVLPSRIVVTGHSLGAALATLAAFWLKTVMPSVPVECWTFGSPRVGNQEFSKLFDSTVDACHRLVYKDDIVPAVPPSHLWVHVSQGVLLLEPECDTYGHTLPKNVSPGSRFRAILGDRPRFAAYTSVPDHEIDLYLAALEDVLAAHAT